MSGEISSQFFSSIMLLAAYATEEVTIEVEGEQTSKPYIDMTIAIMKRFGVQVANHDYRMYTIALGQRYQGSEYAIEGDASAASYFMALAAVTRSDITIRNIRSDSAQGDVGFAVVMERMGCEVERGEDWIRVIGPPQLAPIDIDMNAMPDVAMTLAVVASYAEGRSVISGVSNLRVKETDRIVAIATELARAGIGVEEREDGWAIQGGPANNVQIETYDDHRMAMSFALLGMRGEGMVINHPEVVSKTFPEYFSVLQSLGVRVEEIS